MPQNLKNKFDIKITNRNLRVTKSKIFDGIHTLNVYVYILDKRYIKHMKYI